MKASCTFIASALKEEEWPTVKDPRGNPLFEVALAGKSNVGKSSLINALFQGKRIAKTSSTPGKTQRILFFLVEETFLLVDLPGYGYAKTSLATKVEWSEAINRYMLHRAPLKLLLLLIDARRGPSPEDFQVADWAKTRNLSLLVVLTKADQLSPFELKKRMDNTSECLGECVSFHVKDKEAKRKLMAILHKRMSL